MASPDGHAGRPGSRHNPAVSTGHYENFPVASILCPAHLRAPILAIYRFARTADDLADEGDHPKAIRLARLAEYREGLEACFEGPRPSPWPQVFGPLAQAVRAHRLPRDPLHALLDAFVQDCANAVHPTRTSLLAYCDRSANPIGRLLLHLYGVHDPEAHSQSDQICTALQLINFWQDLGTDVARGRHYIPDEDLSRHDLQRTDLHCSGEPPPQLRSLMASLIDWSETMMRSGAPLVHRLPGRSGWELRLVVQGGLRIVAKMRAAGFDCLRYRPTIGSTELPALLWRAAAMRHRVR